MITDPLFYLLAIPAVIMLGLSKGGFAGLGMVATPMLALVMPPLQGAAILLPLVVGVIAWFIGQSVGRGPESEGDSVRSLRGPLS